MGVGTPLHNKTSQLCESLLWKEWAGYFSVISYDTCHEPEYMAIRHTAGLMDISPLYKYEITGKDAKRFLNYIMARNMNKVSSGQAAYCVWCDEDGKIIDDGVVSCFSGERYRVTSANPSINWFTQNTIGLDVKIQDISQEIAAMSLQGPNSRNILKLVCPEVEKLKFFHIVEAKLDGRYDVVISRTGYTGDLGFEIWVEAKEAEEIWQLLLETGAPYGIRPNGLAALDITRIEAGFVLIDVDFYSSRHVMAEHQKSSPYEIGLGWTVNLKKSNYIGKQALVREKQTGSEYSLVGLDIDWDELEARFSEIGLPPQISHTAWRETVPLYSNNKQIGRATSGCWSPILKKNIALASVETAYSKVGTKLKIEALIDYKREYITAHVVSRPFFDPERKRS